MGWEEVWRVAMKHFIAEPIELRIAIGLALAFSALMILIGLRHAFRSSGPAIEAPPQEILRPLALSTKVLVPLAAAPSALTSAKAHPYRPQKSALPERCKPIKAEAKLHTAPRPLIRGHKVVAKRLRPAG
jgi:hypothetical protein